MFENDKGTHQRTRCKVLWGSAKKRRPHRWDQHLWGTWSRLCLMKSRMSLFEGTFRFRLVGIFRTWGMRFFVLLPSFLPSMGWCQGIPSLPLLSVLGLSQGLLPLDDAQNILHRSHPGQIPNYFNWFLSMMRISGPPLCPSQSSSSHPRGWAQTPLGRISFLLVLSTTSFFLSPLKVCGHFPVDWLCSSISCFTHREELRISLSVGATRSWHSPLSTWELCPQTLRR